MGGTHCIMIIKCGRLYISDAFISVAYYLNGRYRSSSFIVSFESNCFIDEKSRLRFYKPTLHNDNPNEGNVKAHEDSKWDQNFAHDKDVIKRFHHPIKRFINDLIYSLDGLALNYNSNMDRYEFKLNSQTLRSNSEDKQVIISLMGFDSFFVWYLKDNLFDAFAQDVDPNLLYDKGSQGELELF